MSETWTLRDVLNWTTSRFASLDIPTPLLDAQLLLCHVLKMKRVELYMNIDRPLNAEERGGIRDLIKRRMAGEPVAYLLGKKDWHDLHLNVDKRVLIPRPETETLLDFVLGYTRGTAPKVIFDFCTGSGCLAIALARRFPEAKVVGVDVSEDALAVARENAELNGVSGVSWMRADVTDPELYEILKREFGVPDIVVANPPYVTEEEWNVLDIGVRDFEPKLALVAAEDGLQVANKIVAGLKNIGFFEHHGVFAMELAHCQPEILVTRIHHNAATPGLKKLASNASLPDFPVGSFFVVKDLDEKERFLCYGNIQTRDLSMFEEPAGEVPEEEGESHEGSF